MLLIFILFIVSYFISFTVVEYHFVVKQSNIVYNVYYWKIICNKNTIVVSEIEVSEKKKKRSGIWTTSLSLVSLRELVLSKNAGQNILWRIFLALVQAHKEKSSYVLVGNVSKSSYFLEGGYFRDFLMPGWNLITAFLGSLIWLFVVSETSFHNLVSYFKDCTRPLTSSQFRLKKKMGPLRGLPMFNRIRKEKKNTCLLQD